MKCYYLGVLIVFVRATTVHTSGLQWRSIDIQRLPDLARIYAKVEITYFLHCSAHRPHYDISQTLYLFLSLYNIAHHDRSTLSRVALMYLLTYISIRYLDHLRLY